MVPLSGRHRGVETTPGSSTSSPSKNRAIVSGLRRQYGSPASPQSLGAFHAGLVGVGAIVDHQVAAGRHGVYEPVHDRVGLVGVRDVAEDAEHHQGDRLGEVQRAGRRLRQDLVRVAYVRVDAVGDTVPAGASVMIRRVLSGASPDAAARTAASA
jgi:hypothetical protein